MFAREWLELVRNPRLLISVYFIPLLFAAFTIPAYVKLMPVVEMAVVKRSIGAKSVRPSAHPKTTPSEKASTNPDNTKRGTPFPGLDRRLADEPPQRQIIWFMLKLLLSYLPMFAMALPLTLGAASIVGEKQDGTLEPLLATPITTTELLVAKTAFAACPGIVVTWLSYALLLLSAATTLPGHLVVAVFTTPEWLGIILLLVPLLSLVVTLLLVMISAWVTDPRSAQQVAALFVLPAMAIVTLGMMVLTKLEGILLWAIPPTVLVGLFLLRVAVQTFGREAILTRWR